MLLDAVVNLTSTVIAGEDGTVLQGQHYVLESVPKKDLRSCINRLDKDSFLFSAERRIPPLIFL